MKKWREDEEITQAEAAKRAGVTQSAWCEWEGGQKIPQIHKVEELERLTNGAVTVGHWAARSQAEADERAAKRAATAEAQKPTGS